MSRIAYVNGRYVPHRRAAVSIDDRGLQFADAVYEVCEVRDGRLIDERRHLARLRRSLGEIELSMPVSFTALRVILREVARRNRVVDGIVYLQISRGVAPRNHLFPPDDVRPGLIVTAHGVDRAKGEARAAAGVAVATATDERWKRVDIKTTALLPNILAKQRAKQAGAYEAWLVAADGTVTEGSSTNAWIITVGGVLVTRPGHSAILRGITRGVVRDLAGREGLAYEERAFTVAEALAAREAFLTSAGNIVTPIVSIDGRPVGNGRVGPLAPKLRALFHSLAERGGAWARGAFTPSDADVSDF
jgi:D-alanine transaminase